jgi:hypothetical protein
MAMTNPNVKPALVQYLKPFTLGLQRLALILSILVLSYFSYSQTVYVTRTGEKYHDDGCRYLSKSKIEITLADAKDKGYTACSVCKPGTKISPGKSQTVISPSSIRKVTSTQCTGTTKAGNRCKRMTTSAGGRCYQH